MGKGELKRRKRVRTQFSNFLMTWKNNRIWAKWDNGVINNFLTNRQKQRGKSWEAHFFSPSYKGRWGDSLFCYFLPTRLQAKVFSYRLELSDSSVKTVKFQRIANHKNQVERNCKLMGKCTPKMKPWNCCLSSRILQGTRGMQDNWEMVTLAIKDAEAKFSDWRTESLSPFTSVQLVSVQSRRIRLLDMFCGPFTPSLKKKNVTCNQARI